ncbi:MAG: hypothetical protein GX780_01665 [Campylobacteraceae bacterium]|nr:hypothetical protein [Campylobacteraceae bacterium]
MRVKWLIILISLIISGCSLKPVPKESMSAHILIKTPEVRILDFAFIKIHKHNTRLHVLNSGKTILDISLNEDICLNGPCYDRLVFNRRFFNRTHYPTLFDDILHSRPIYGGRNLEKTQKGFTQRVEVDGTSIFFKSEENIVEFKDIEKNITIRITF